MNGLMDRMIGDLYGRSGDEEGGATTKKDVRFSYLEVPEAALTVVVTALL